MKGSGKGQSAKGNGKLDWRVSYLYLLHVSHRKGTKYSQSVLRNLQYTEPDALYDIKIYIISTIFTCPVREPGVRGDDGGGRGGHPRQLPQHLRPLQVQGELSIQGSLY